MKLRKFDLEAAKRGEPIQCRDGTPVRFIAHVPEAYDGPKIVAMRGNGLIYIWHESGEFVKDEQTGSDLVMAPKKRRVWVNFYGSSSIARYFSTEHEADQYPSWTDCISNINRIGNRAYPVEIEE